MYPKTGTLLVTFLFSFSLAAEGENELDKLNPYDFGLSGQSKQELDLKTAISRTLKDNTFIQRKLTEIEQNKLPAKKYTGQFNWNLTGKAESYKTTLPSNQNNLLSGNKMSRDYLAVGLEKNFATGTYFHLETGAARFDSNSFESPNAPAMFKYLAIPPQYTGTLTVKIQQELLKNSFGKNHANQFELFKNEYETGLQNLVLQLTGIVTDTIVKYWTLEVYRYSVITFQELEDNTKFIRDITRRKTGLGISEPFELNHWNALLLESSNQLDNAILQKNIAEKELYRILNTTQDIQIKNVTELETKKLEFDLDQDIVFAYANRIDLQILQKQKEFYALKKKAALLAAGPSLGVSLEYTTLGQNTKSPMQNYYSSQGVFSFKYPELKGQFQFSYPLSDLKTETEIEDYEASMLETQEEIDNLKNEIRKEMELRHLKIASDFQVFQDAEKILAQTELFHNKLKYKYRSGKYNSELVKNSLDMLTQARMKLIQSKINYNVSILLYELSKNNIFPKYGIDVKAMMEKASQ